MSEEKDMFLKRVSLSGFVAIFICLIMWLVIEAVKPESLPVGSFMPELEYNGIQRSYMLEPDNAHNTMIVLFHRNCEHCLYQINLFNNEFINFIGKKIILLTTEKNFFKNNFQKQWPVLADADNVHWGVVNKKVFKNTFGSTATPTIYLFNKSGHLINKIRGEVRLERILENLSGPEH
jgi:hypothetical protein